MASADGKTGGTRKPRVKSVIEMPTAADPVATALPVAEPSTAPLPPVASMPQVEAVPPVEAASPVEAMPPVEAASPVEAMPPVETAPAPAAVELASLPIAAPDPVDLVADANPVALMADPVAENVPPAASAVEPKKEASMNETYTTAADAMKNGAEAMKASVANSTETAMNQGKAAFDQVASKSREAIEHGMKQVDEFAGMARGNVEAMLASSRAAAQGIEAIAREVADFSRKSFEETTAAARAMTTVKTPNELMQLQNDFAKTQFDAAVAEMSKLSETMVKLMGEVFEPMQARATVAADKMKAMVGTVGQ